MQIVSVTGLELIISLGKQKPILALSKHLGALIGSLELHVDVSMELKYGAREMAISRANYGYLWEAPRIDVVRFEFGVR